MNSNDIDEKKYTEDKEYIKKAFDGDNTELPESLSKDNMMAKLDEKRVSTPKKVSVKRNWTKPIALIAAAAACLIMVFNPLLRSNKAESFGMEGFGSYEEIDEAIDKMIGNSRERVLYGAGGDIAAAPETDAAAPEGNAAAPDGAVAKNSAQAAPGQSDTSASHSETYLQVEGVDEADKVKVDDKYLYFINSEGNKIYIYTAKSGKAKKASVIKADKDDYLTDIFINGDRLVVISEHLEYRRNAETKASVTVYDITDRKSPKKESGYMQSGYPVSQRMVGDIVYLVTNRYAAKNDYPVCGRPKNEKKLAPSDISCIPCPMTPEYTIIGAVDTSTGKELSHVTKAILGGSRDIYANGENLYIACSTYKEKDEETQNEGKNGLFIFGNRDYYTGIIKVRMADGKLKVLKTASVPGSIDDQFSMDEKDGNFRIATTSDTESEDGEFEEVNNLFILDKDLKTIGKVTGFARGESIKAVKYIEDTAYVITYKETDPLFVIDLSDSRKPKIKGEVKISGFSTLLMPVSEDKLLGIGYSTEFIEPWDDFDEDAEEDADDDASDDDSIEATDGLKFALFDISDPASPKVADSKELKGVMSPVQDDHRAITVLGGGRFAVPCSVDHYKTVVEDGEEYEDYLGTTGAAYVVSAADNKVSFDDTFETKDGIERCPMIDGYLYTIGVNDKVESFKLSK